MTWTILAVIVYPKKQKDKDEMKNASELLTNI